MSGDSKVDLKDGLQLELRFIVAAGRQEQGGGGDGPVMASKREVRAEKEILLFAARHPAKNIGHCPGHSDVNTLTPPCQS